LREIPLHNEKDLLQQVAEGDEEAFRVIFNLYAPRLKSYLFKLSRSKEVVEDILQDVFLNIWKNRAGLGAIENFDSYLFIAVRNLAHRSFQRRARETLIVAQLSKTGSNEVSFEEENRMTGQEVRAFVQQAINKLSPQQKKIFLLSRVHGLSHEEIARELGISRRTVTNTITEALRSLRLDIEGYYGSLGVVIFILYCAS
jgi:RNA polymerase sigma-70 factor (family 1)